MYILDYITATYFLFEATQQAVQALDQVTIAKYLCDNLSPTKVLCECFNGHLTQVIAAELYDMSLSHSAHHNI